MWGKNLTEENGEGKMLTSVTLEIHRSCETKGKGTAHKQCTLVDNITSHTGTFNSSESMLELNG